MKAHFKAKVRHLLVEVTRRCNLSCRHCLRGNAENMDMTEDMIDSLLHQVCDIYHLTFTGGEPALNIPIMQYFIDKCSEQKIGIGYVSLITNGTLITPEFVDLCIDIHRMSIHGLDLRISDDKYHAEQMAYDDTPIRGFRFYRKLPLDDLLAEGRGAKLPNAYAMVRAARFCREYENYLTLNCKGEIINGCAWSYKNQKHHKICDLKNFAETYNKVKA